MKMALSLLFFSVSAFADIQSPLIIGHRGASGYLPEHTLESYDLAIQKGADFIEPDLVMTKDGVLIARHEPEISSTTDAATKFPDRKKTKSAEGHTITGWFAEDFTLAEIKTLRAKERLEFRDRSNDLKFAVPTFDEILKLAIQKTKETGRPIGVYPEMKHPKYFTAIGLPLEPAIAKALDAHAMNRPDAPVYLQSFDLDSLKKVKTLVKVPLIFLMDDSKQTTPRALKELKKTVDGIGPNKNLLLTTDRRGKLLKTTSLVKDAHAVGLKVHPYTFRSDANFLPKEYAGDPVKEYLQFFAMGVDGVFTDFPDHAIKARAQIK